MLLRRDILSDSSSFLVRRCRENVITCVGDDKVGESGCLFAPHPRVSWLMDGEEIRDTRQRHCWYDRLHLLGGLIKCASYRTSWESDSLARQGKALWDALKMRGTVRFVVGICPLCGLTVVLHCMGGGVIDTADIWDRIFRDARKEIDGSMLLGLDFLYNRGTFWGDPGDAHADGTVTLARGALVYGYYATVVTGRFGMARFGKGETEKRGDLLKKLTSMHLCPAHSTVGRDSSELSSMVEAIDPSIKKKKRVKNLTKSAKNLAKGVAVVTATSAAAGATAGLISGLASLISGSAGKTKGLASKAAEAAELEKLKDSAASKYSEIKTVIE